MTIVLYSIQDQNYLLGNFYMFFQDDKHPCTNTYLRKNFVKTITLVKASVLHKRMCLNNEPCVIKRPKGNLKLFLNLLRFPAFFVILIVDENITHNKMLRITEKITTNNQLSSITEEKAL